MRNRTFEIQRSRRASCSPEVVRRLILDPSTWPQWQREITSIEPRCPLEEGDVGRGEADMLGFEVHGHTTVTRLNGVSFEQDALVGVRMRIRYDVRPYGDGVIVTHSLVAHMPGGALGRVLTLFLRWRLRALQRVALERLTNQSETASPL